VRARLHSPGEVHRAGVEEELLRQRGFPCVRVRNNGKRAPPGHFSSQFIDDDFSIGKDIDVPSIV